MTTQSPGQSVMQSTETKELEERITSLFQQWDVPINPDRVASLASELGKEREADRKTINDLLALRTQMFAAEKCWQEAEGRLHKIIEIRDERIETLKRELSEAREQWMQSAKDQGEILANTKAQHLALSASYQRQKEALVNLRGWAVANTTKPIHDLLAVTDSALAETPDVSLLDTVVSVLSELVELVDSPDYKSDSFTTQPARALLSTLQPHQK